MHDALIVNDALDQPGFWLREWSVIDHHLLRFRQQVASYAAMPSLQTRRRV